MATDLALSCIRLHPSPSGRLLVAPLSLPHIRLSEAVRVPTVPAASSRCVIIHVDTIECVYFHCRQVFYVFFPPSVFHKHAQVEMKAGNQTCHSGSKHPDRDRETGY